MFNCPNCGERVKNDATCCPHCGSDPETGWNPDVDYYSLDIPGYEEDDEHDRPAAYTEDSSLRLRGLTGPGLLALALLLFTSVGYEIHGFWIFAASIYLAIITLLYVGNGSQRERRPRH